MNDDYQNNNQSSGDNTSSGTGRGFAGMDPKKQQEIASKGGISAHQKGVAHEFTSDEAKRAGQKGGRARSRNQKQDNEL